MDDYDPEDLSSVAAFDAVASHPRQAILGVLLSNGSKTVEVEALAEEVVDELAPVEDVRTTADSVEELELTLVHHHLPQLDDEDLVEFDEDDYTVDPGDHIDDVDPLV